MWHRTRSLSFWAGFGVVPAFFALPAPPLSVPGRFLGNRVIKSRHKTVDFSCSFLFRPADPPPARSRGRSGYLDTPTVHRTVWLLVFSFSVV